MIYRESRVFFRHFSLLSASTYSSASLLLYFLARDIIADIAVRLMLFPFSFA
jgi:hypothetical protein